MAQRKNDKTKATASDVIKKLARIVGDENSLTEANDALQAIIDKRQKDIPYIDSPWLGAVKEAALISFNRDLADKIKCVEKRDGTQDFYLTLPDDIYFLEKRELETMAAELGKNGLGLKDWSVLCTDQMRHFGLTFNIGKKAE